jgi:two-component system, NtrC family, sensor kinase
MNAKDWEDVFNLYNASKSFFSDIDNEPDAIDYINTLKEFTGASDCFIILNDSGSKSLKVCTESSCLQSNISDLVEVLPLLFGSCKSTLLTHKEVCHLQENIPFKQNNNFIDGAFFCTEINEMKSVLCVFLHDETNEPMHKEALEKIKHIEQFFNEFLKTSLIAKQGDNLSKELRISKKRQSIWLESLAWINQAAVTDFSDLEMLDFYNAAVFQLKILVVADNALSYQVEQVDGDDKIIHCIASHDYQSPEDQKQLMAFIRDELTFKSLKKRGCVFVESSQHPSLGKIGIHHLLLLPLYVQNDLRQIIVLNKKENAFSDNEVIVANLFAEGVEHIIERRDLMQSITKHNLALQTERNEQKKLIGQLKEAQEQLLQQEKMASIGQLAAGVAHEINNPVGYVNSNINALSSYMQDLFKLIGFYENLVNELDHNNPIIKQINSFKNEIDYKFLQDDVRDLVEESIEGVIRVKDIVKDLKDFSHVDEGECQLANINKGIQSTLNIVNNEIKYRADVELNLGDLPEIECQSSQINQIFMNLLVNASHAMEERGKIKVTTWADSKYVYAEISDEGKGIESEHLTKIFDPFFTTKPVGEGTGLGLSLSYSIAEKHHGDISVESVVGQGTTFTLKLPIKQKS